jgi:hypothetical protein
MTSSGFVNKPALQGLRARQLGSTNPRGSAMKVPFARAWTVIATLTGSLAVAGTALATEPALAKAAAPSLSITDGVALLGLSLQPPPASVADGAPWAADVRQLLSEKLPTDKRPARDCTKPCDATNKGPLIAERLLSELGADPLLATVMAPVTRGVPISTGDGAPALKLAVIPAQITRGSGFVAIGYF